VAARLFYGFRYVHFHRYFLLSAVQAI
jgi:hypothetical protein